jgi:hypothetical protein
LSDELLKDSKKNQKFGNKLIKQKKLNKRIDIANNTDNILKRRYSTVSRLAFRKSNVFHKKYGSKSKMEK